MKLIWAVLALGAAFEAMTVLATQDKAVRAASPWQDDPPDVFVSFALFAVPMLALAILVRLVARRAPSGPGREGPTARAAGALTAVVGGTLAAEWAAVATRAHAPAWNGSTTVLIVGLAVLSFATVAAATALWRRRAPRGAARPDWLGDVPLLGPERAEWVRAHATAVFVTLSLLAAAAVIGAQAIGEGWTNPLLIAWALLVETAMNFAFCVVANAVAGFIARPARSRRARVAEAAVLAGAAGLVLMTAFRDPVWTAVAAGPVGSVPLLVALTVGAGLAAAAVTAAVMVRRTAA
ncbi:hypothetical protein [Dactylosporangium sp. NPDC049140]|uniref:hypothetical protein n=1 Tax=Dactylosporangium sp. NPDC049140 TaxID=3155647 RepID=UPI0033E3AC3E